jgi:hypothetical protein
MKKQAVNSQFSPRRFSRPVVVCACLAAAMAFVAFNSVQASSSFLEFSASAYGTYAFVGSTVVAGKTAPVSVGGGCGTAAVGVTHSGTVASVTVPPVITTGAINTTAASTTNSATATSDVHQISLLGGFITASEVKAVSTTSHSGAGFTTSGAGSALVNLVIATSPPTVINAVPAPNTTILLAGIGKVVLNEQIVSNSSSSSMRGLTVNMIHVYVTVANTIGGGAGIRVGTQIIVANAVSHLTQISGPGSLDGTAFGTSINSAIIKSSPTVPASVGCQGNALITNTQAGIKVPADGSLLNSGTITDTAQGSVTTSLSSAETTSTVQNVNLLAGIVTASAVHADAKATTTPPGTTFNFSEGSGSYFTGLVVQGVAYANVAANTKLTITLNGKTLGTLYLHRVIQGTNSITVRMIELVIASGNSLGLPTGMDITVASASASLHSPTHP